MKSYKKYVMIFCIGVIAAACSSTEQVDPMSKLLISQNKRYFMQENGEPFFWLGDTAWLLFTQLNREEAVTYLEDRSKKGFNVVQAILLPVISSTNIYGDSALVNKNAATPAVTEGNIFSDSLQYDYWDHVDYIVDLAASKNIYMALVPAWGGNVSSGHFSRQEARKYAAYVAERYKDEPNIIWLNGGDTFGSDSTATWNIIGNTLNKTDPNHLITFHPRGRMMSSMWFHDEPWLDFNMFQSGHRRYDQDSTKLNFGEDNWRYVKMDYNRTPIKPTLDGEPSYEGIPQGLHDHSQPRWKAHDIRRYAYWSVFAGAFGFTYGHNAVWQMHGPEDGGAFAVQQYWYNVLDAPGAQQMIYLKKLMLSRPYFERIPDPSLVANQGERYDHLAATRGDDYAFVYTYNGRNMIINMGRIAGEKVKASWYSPRDGSMTEIGVFSNSGTQPFDPPGQKEEGNDWVLILDSM